MKFVNQTFENTKVFLDGHEFIDCIFKKCDIEYSGTMGVHLTGNQFANCTWGFNGPASNTIKFMTAMYADGGDAAKLIEGTIANIRAGKGLATNK